ncbi:MAG: dTDP-4-dehydrorhamnose 3,5-epimerase, partial [Nocardioidaceae bacterium]|nr:dTDP-4-dehydrorhamnose 3,5-epimerase [Nocardioidaceae bacterium]
MTTETGPGIRDTQTVTSEGKPTTPSIEGVVVHTPPVHLDHRGALYELYNRDPELWSEPIVYSYVFTVRPGQMKGWGMH